jgi:hypothetical protein
MHAKSYTQCGYRHYGSIRIMIKLASRSHGERARVRDRERAPTYIGESMVRSESGRNRCGTLATASYEKSMRSHDMSADHNTSHGNWPCSQFGQC